MRSDDAATSATTITSPYGTDHRCTSNAIGRDRVAKMCLPMLQRIDSNEYLLVFVRIRCTSLCGMSAEI